MRVWRWRPIVLLNNTMFCLPQEHNITAEDGHHDRDTYRSASDEEIKKKINIYGFIMLWLVKQYNIYTYQNVESGFHFPRDNVQQTATQITI